MSNDWFEDLERRLNARLERFLADNPDQEALLQEQEQLERRRDLAERRLQLQQQAERERQTLLQLAEEIRQWQGRITRARTAGAEELAARAEAHLASLMDQGRLAWDQLGRLGQSWEAVNEALDQLRAQQAQQNLGRSPSESHGSSRAGGQASRASGSGAAHGGSVDLERAWADFEANQELEQLRRRQS